GGLGGVGGGAGASGAARDGRGARGGGARGGGARGGGGRGGGGRGGRGEEGGDGLDRVDQAVAGAGAGWAVGGGGDAGHHLGLVEAGVGRPDQGHDAGGESRREAGAVAVGVVGLRERAGEGGGHAGAGGGDADRGAGVGKAGQRTVLVHRADREDARIGGGIERAGGAVGAVVARGGHHHDVVGLRELDGRGQGRGADRGQRQVDDLSAVLHRVLDGFGRPLAGAGSGPASTRSPNWGVASTPLSITATVMPAPRVSGHTLAKLSACLAQGVVSGARPAGLPGP